MPGSSAGTPFLVAGYLITWVVLTWYVWWLGKRSHEAGRLVRAAEPAAPTPDEPAGEDRGAATEQDRGAATEE